MCETFAINILTKREFIKTVQFKARPLILLNEIFASEAIMSEMIFFVVFYVA